MLVIIGCFLLKLQVFQLACYSSSQSAIINHQYATLMNPNKAKQLSLALLSFVCC